MDRLRKHREKIGMKFSIVVFCLLVLCAMPATARNKNLPYDTVFAPGDEVCLYDIGPDDPLVNNYNDSLKYWDNAASGDAKPRHIMRASVRRLIFRILLPGLQVGGQPDKLGQYWYSGKLVVVKGGYIAGRGKRYAITLGENVLLGQKGKPWIRDWEVINFKQARFVKKRLFDSCPRKYKNF